MPTTWILRSNTAHRNAHFGAVSGQILLDDLQYSGREASLLVCSHSGINDHNCGHHEDASVTCECDLCVVACYLHSLCKGLGSTISHSHLTAIFYDVTNMHEYLNEENYSSNISLPNEYSSIRLFI